MLISSVTPIPNPRDLEFDPVNSMIPPKIARRGGGFALTNLLNDANHARRSAGVLPSSWSIDRLMLRSRPPPAPQPPGEQD